MADILIVDEQPCIRELISKELILEGHQVNGIGDAESVGKYLRFLRPDLVVLDLFSDGFKGMRVLHDIKGQNPGLPVIIYTAYDSYAGDPRLSQADGFVIKSIHFDELKQRIAQVLVRRRATQAALESQQRWLEFSLSSRQLYSPLRDHNITKDLKEIQT